MNENIENIKGLINEIKKSKYEKKFVDGCLIRILIELEELKRDM